MVCLFNLPSVHAETLKRRPSPGAQDIGPIGPDRNWKGIGISLLVILVVLSLIGMSIVLLSKGDQPAASRVNHGCLRGAV